MGFFVGLAHSDGELIGAGCGFVAASVALEIPLDLIYGHAVDQLADGLQIAVAAADKFDVAYHVAVEFKVDLRRAYAFRAIRVFHFIDPFCCCIGCNLIVLYKLGFVKRCKDFS